MTKAEKRMVGSEELFYRYFQIVNFDLPKIDKKYHRVNDEGRILLRSQTAELEGELRKITKELKRLYD